MRKSYTRVEINYLIIRLCSSLSLSLVQDIISMQQDTNECERELGNQVLQMEEMQRFFETTPDKSATVQVAKGSCWAVVLQPHTLNQRCPDTKDVKAEYVKEHKAIGEVWDQIQSIKHVGNHQKASSRLWVRSSR